jgi:predicted ATPase
VSLGLVDGTASEERAVAIATLRLLTVIVAAQPVLAVVDDVNWLDRASSSVLTYVARRVGGTGIALIASMRTGERTPLSAAAWTPTSSSRCPSQRRTLCCKSASRA